MLIVWGSQWLVILCNIVTNNVVQEPQGSSAGQQTAARTNSKIQVQRKWSFHLLESSAQGKKKKKVMFDVYEQGCGRKLFSSINLLIISLTNRLIILFIKCQQILIISIIICRSPKWHLQMSCFANQRRQQPTYDWFNIILDKEKQTCMLGKLKLEMFFFFLI